MLEGELSTATRVTLAALVATWRGVAVLRRHDLVAMGQTCRTPRHRQRFWRWRSQDYRRRTASRMLTGLTSTPMDAATDWIAASWPGPSANVGRRPSRGGRQRLPDTAGAAGAAALAEEIARDRLTYS
jgi:hypothetical protein